MNKNAKKLKNIFLLCRKIISRWQIANLFLINMKMTILRNRNKEGDFNLI